MMEMTHEQRVAINKKLDALNLKPRRKTNWCNGFTIEKSKSSCIDMDLVEHDKWARVDKIRGKGIVR